MPIPVTPTESLLPESNWFCDDTTVTSPHGEQASGSGGTRTPKTYGRTAFRERLLIQPDRFLEYPVSAVLYPVMPEDDRFAARRNLSPCDNKPIRPVPGMRPKPT